MKKINRLCLAALLTLTFAMSAAASDQIECGRTAAPPSQSRADEIECGKLTVYVILQDVLAVL
ncbi:MAG TPA: hypothetical protein VGC91_17360 [Pyrinomonadaceae bacterium]|jgi:hypothetical protein